MTDQVKEQFRLLYNLIESQTFDVAKNAQLKNVISDNETLKAKNDALKQEVAKLTELQETDSYIEMGPGKRDDVLHYIEPRNLDNKQIMDALERLCFRIGPKPLLNDLENLIRKYNA